MVTTFGSNIVSAFTGGVPVKAIYAYGEKVWPTSTPSPANNEIFYTTSTGNVIQLYDDSGFGANLLSNTVHSSGNYCVLTFDGPVLYSGIDSFKEKSSLLSIILPSSVTTISTRSFYKASGLTNVDMKDNVTIIEPFAFERCTSLTSIRISERCMVFGRDGLGSCFYGCTGLTSVTIPSSVTKMFPSVFSGCSNLSEVIVNATTPPELLISSTNEYTQFKNCSPNLLIKVPAGSVQAYKTSAGWSSYASQIVSQ